MAAFAKQLNRLESHWGRRWNHKTWQILSVFRAWYNHDVDLVSRCLTHILNLATQAIISMYSKSKHFDPANPTDHEPDTDAFRRDEVGLVRAITVKVSQSHIDILVIVTDTLMKGPFFCKTKAAFQGYSRTGW
jgi:hypothetical protein